jgi:hypothetical protein
VVVVVAATVLENLDLLEEDSPLAQALSVVLALVSLAALVALL